MSSPHLQDRLSQLRRRRFVKVAAWYVVAAWVVIQVATSTFPYLGLPSSLVTAVIIVAMVGFPVALVSAWLQERSSSDPASSAASRVPLAAAGLALIVLAAGAYAYWRLHARRTTAADMDFASTTLAQVTSSTDVEEFPAISHDGLRLAFSREMDGFRQIFIRDLTGGTERLATREPGDHIQPSWSPDGKALLYVRANDRKERLEPGEVFGMYSGGSVWRMDLSTGRAQKIIDNAFNPAYSLDGKHIAFDASFGGSRRIWVADEVGRNPRQITTDASEAVQHILPRWSPDGTRVVFQNIEKNKLDIRVVDVASGRIAKTTDDMVRDVDPVWLPSGKAVVFSSPRGGGWNLWQVRLNADGSAAGALQQVTTGAGQDLQAAPAADGESVFFVTMNQNADIWLLPVDPATGKPTGEPTPLIATTREDSRPAWSPDGKMLAFNSDRSGDMNLYVYSMVDHSTRQLTSGSGGDYQATWSPDGQRLAFFSSRSGSADIWTVDVTARTLRQLTRDSALDVNPVYAPDGKRIAFQSDRGGHKEVWLMSADGSEQRQLTSTGAGDHFMVFSDDGKSLYYAQRTQVMQVDVTSGEAKPVMEAPKGLAHMSFSPNRSRFMDVVAHKTLWATSLSATSQPQELFAFPDADVRIDYPRWSPDGRFVAFDRLKPTGGDVWVLKLKR